jgi:hypothetical protein
MRFQIAQQSWSPAARRDQRGLVPVPSYQEIGRAPDVGVTDHVMVS